MMKNKVLMLFMGVVFMAASCSTHRTCPTYTKADKVEVSKKSI